MRSRIIGISQAGWGLNACGLFLAVLILCQLDKVAVGGPPQGDMASWEARSQKYPFDDELRNLAQDLSSPAYQKVLDSMIPTDLEAEWQRVATRDNFQTFLKKQGGLAQIEKSPELKAAYEVRREIAERFLNLVRSAYEKRKVKVPFDSAKVDALCAGAADAKPVGTESPEQPLRTLAVSAEAERQWPQFRGPTADGIVRDTTFPTTWSATRNIVWKIKLPGSGNSSPIIWGDQIFLTVASTDGLERKLLSFARSDGKLLWTLTAPSPLQKLETLYQKNSFASSTPVTDGTRVIAFLGNSGMICADFQGKRLWHTSLGPITTMHGPGTTPVIYQDRVLLIQDQNNADSLFIALDKTTGKILWRQKRPRGMCWSTPLLVNSRGRDELLYNGSHFLIGYDPLTGVERWRAGGASREAIPMAVIGGGKIFSVSGRNGPMYALRPGEQGDVTATHVLWTLPRGGPHVPTPVWVNHRLFLVNDLGLASCWHAETGKMLWQRRLNGRYSTSILSAGDKLMATSESGTTYLFKAADTYEEIARNELDETVLATPAILQGRIYFRTAEHLLCIGDKP